MSACRRATTVAIAVAGALVAAGAEPATADPAPPRVVAMLSDGADIAATTMIGPSGEVWQPAAIAGTWERRFAGGVATDVEGAVRVDGAITVCGRGTPLYRLHDGTWDAFRLSNRGRSLLASSGAPALHVGKHVYVVRKQTWVRLAGVPRPLRAVWASNDTRAVIIDDLGALARLTASALAPVRVVLDAGDELALLVGAPGQTAFAVSRRGAVYQVGASGPARRLASDALVGFSPQAAAIDGAGDVVVVGVQAATAAAEPAAADAGPATDAGGATVAAPAPVPPPPSDGALAMLRVHQGAVSRSDLGLVGRAIAVAADRKGQLLLATADGSVHLRAADGTWSTAARTDALPAAGRDVAGAGPARSR